MSTLNNINKIEDINNNNSNNNITLNNNNNNNNNNNSLYNNSIIDQLDTFVLKIDQCKPQVKKIVWDEYYRLSTKKTFNNINQQTQIYNQFFINQNNNINNFTPYLNQLLNNDNINYHSLELLYKAFTNSINKNNNLLNQSSADNNRNNNSIDNNENGQTEMSISSNIFFTSTLWGYSYPSALQQLTLICYWLPVIKKLSKQQKKKLWQTCLMFPLFQKQQQPFENPGYFKTPDYQNIISKWFEAPIENLNSITIFFSAIGYLVELNLFKNDYYYPQSKVLVFNSSFSQCEQQQSCNITSSTSLSNSTLTTTTCASLLPPKLKNSTSSLSSSLSSDEEFETETDEEEIRSAKKLKKSNDSITFNNSNNNNNNNSSSSNIDSPLMYDGVPSLSPLSSPKTRLRSFSSTSVSSSNSSPLLSFGSLHVDHPSYLEEIEINNNNHTNSSNSNNKQQKNNNNNNKKSNNNSNHINTSNNSNNSVQSINSLIDTYINKKESENSSLLSCLTKKNLINKSSSGTSLLPTRSSSWSSYSTSNTGSNTLNKSSQLNSPSKNSLLPSLPSTTSTLSPLKSSSSLIKPSNNENTISNNFSLLDALALTATTFSEMKSEKSSSPSSNSIAPIPRLPDMGCNDHNNQVVGEYELSNENQHEVVPTPIHKKRVVNGTSICI